MFGEDLEENIHGKRDCIRCGAGCVYYRVTNDDGTVLKEAGEICPFLNYDLDSQLATCTLYDKPERPSQCAKFECVRGNISFLVAYGRNWDGLKETASEMPRIMRTHMKTS